MSPFLFDKSSQPFIKGKALSTPKANSGRLPKADCNPPATLMIQLTSIEPFRISDVFTLCSALPP